MKRGSTQPGVETALCLQGKCDFFTRDGNAHGWRTKKQFFFFSGDVEWKEGNK